MIGTAQDNSGMRTQMDSNLSECLRLMEQGQSMYKGFSVFDEYPLPRAQ